MRVDRDTRAQNEYASRTCGVALSIVNNFGKHASRFTHLASRITRMWSRGFKCRLLYT